MIQYRKYKISVLLNTTRLAVTNEYQPGDILQHVHTFYMELDRTYIDNYEHIAGKVYSLTVEAGERRMQADKSLRSISVGDVLLIESDGLPPCYMACHMGGWQFLGA